jgi:hypothetical protein
VKSAEETMNNLEAYDLTGSFAGRRRAGRLLPSHRGTLRGGARAGRLMPGTASRRAGVIDAFLPKLEELIERSRERAVPTRRTRRSPRLGMRGQSGPPAVRSPGGLARAGTRLVTWRP